MTARIVKPVIGLVVAFAFGFVCRAFGIPSPAPPLVVGALLVMAMTVGYITVDRLMARPARQAVNCGGPSGATSAGYHTDRVPDRARDQDGRSH